MKHRQLTNRCYKAGTNTYVQIRRSIFDPNTTLASLGHQRSELTQLRGWGESFKLGKGEPERKRQKF